MKVNTTVALTLILLSLMVGAGVVSAAWGFAMGREALKGITQPDSSPTSNLTNRQQQSASKAPLTILKESDILARVKARMDGKDKQPATQPKKSDKPQSQSSNPDGESFTTQRTLPVSTQEDGVVLEVAQIRHVKDNLELDVRMRNEGTHAVRFLYSLLNVQDDQGRSIQAIVDGLPGELPPSRETFTGTIKVQETALTESKQLSVNLTDYPDRQLQLQLSGIPIER